MCVCVCEVCVCGYRYLFPTVKKLQLHPSDAIHFLKEGFSLPWNSPSRLAWLTSKPKDLPASVYLEWGL